MTVAVCMRHLCLMFGLNVSSLTMRFLVCGVLLSSSPASATILFAGGEDTSVTRIGAAYGNLLSSGRAGFARTSLGITNGGSTADPPPNRLQTPAFTATSTLWVHGQFLNGNSSTSVLNGQQSLIVRSPDGNARILVRQTGTAGTLKVSTRNIAGTITDLATASAGYVGGSTNAFDLFINYTCSGSGGVQMYLQGVQVINYTGNPCTDSATTLNQVEYLAFANTVGGVTCADTCWSELIVADEDTRGMALWTTNPAAAGNTQSWTPSTLANVNKAAISDSTVVSASTNNSISEWTVSNSIPTGSWSVKAVVQEARVQVGTTGPQHFEWVARTGGNDYVTGSLAPTTSFTTFSNQIWLTNPSTSAAWSTTDITAAGFNLGIESLP